MKMENATVKIAIGYPCAAAIVITMLIVDGVTAFTVGAAVAASCAGLVGYGTGVIVKNHKKG